jgi:uncharacterized repeat protein (TIGR03803 family)
MKKFALLTLIGLFLLALPVRAQINLLHEFAGGVDDGDYPYGSLVISGSTLYGMTNTGGNNNYGTIFKIQADGSDYTVIHEFLGGADDGRWPYGSLIISGSTLYGMTNWGGNTEGGTIFKIQTDGTDFALLHKFAGGNNDGAHPEGSLIISESTLYGMTNSGGDTARGTIFKIGTDGNNFGLLHEFTGGANDGSTPRGSLIISGSNLYGMTFSGGAFDYGTIFKIQTSGSGFALLHSELHFMHH